jgi:hypothetical protein
MAPRSIRGLAPLATKGDALFSFFFADLDLTPAQALGKGRPLALMMAGRL